MFRGLKLRIIGLRKLTHRFAVCLLTGASETNFRCPRPASFTLERLTLIDDSRGVHFRTAWPEFNILMKFPIPP